MVRQALHERGKNINFLSLGIGSKNKIRKNNRAVHKHLCGRKLLLDIA